MTARQLIATTSDGRMLGIVLDASPMRPVDAERFLRSGGARRLADAERLAAEFAGGAGWTLAECFYRPRGFSMAGRSRRTYPARMWCRVLAAAPAGVPRDEALAVPA